MKSVLKIANAQGFWGDQCDGALQLMEKQPDLNFITLDYLSEVSLSIMAIQKEKDPKLGYAADFIGVVRDVGAYWKKGSKVKLIANAGGLNPKACAEACLQVLKKLECGHIRIGIVTGDDVLGFLKNDALNPDFKNLDSFSSLNTVLERLNTANAYLGAKSIVEALLKGADIVITGRVADPSLTVAPCVAHFGWQWTDFNKIAQATVAGHLIECGTQVTGGISKDWLQMENLSDLGFPVIEIEDNGDFVITKPKETAGAVTKEIVKEQLLYEIGDPENYISPDVVVSFMEITLEEDGPDRIKVTGAKGRAPSSKYKVSATYADGYKAEGCLIIYGRDCKEKALKTAEILFRRMEKLGAAPERRLVECIGCGDVVPGVKMFKENDQFLNANLGNDRLECLLRVAAADSRREVLECFSKQIAPMVTSGAPGTTGYTSGRPHIRQVFGFWPCLIERKLITSSVEMFENRL